MRRIIRGILGVIIGIFIAVGGIALLIYLSREKLVAWVITEVGKSISARIHIQAVKVGSLRALPDLGIRVKGLLMQTQQGETLFTAQEVLLHLNLWEALVEGKYRVRGLTMDEPRCWFIYDKKGHSPWDDITLNSQTGEGEASPWALEQVVVNTGALIYRDRQVDFGLNLLITRLEAEIRGQSGAIKISGRSDGLIQYISHRKKVWLDRQNFALAGDITYEAPWLVFSPLEVGVAGLSARLGGGIRLGQERPDLSLRIEALQLDLSRIKTWWPEVPEELAHLNGALSGQGDLIGPAGKGKLPRLRLVANLHTSQPFSVQDYICHAIHARGRIEWDAELPRQSFIVVDTFFLAGGERDTVYLNGTYNLGLDKVAMNFGAHLDLASLRNWKVPYADSLSGEIWVQGAATRTKNHWQLSGRGSLHQVAWPSGTIEQLAFELTPHQLKLSEMNMRYGDMQIRAPYLEIESYARLWDTSAAPLFLRGQVFLPRLSFFSTQSTSGRSVPWQSDILVQIDTFRWGEVVCGPIRGRFLRERDTFRIVGAEIKGVANGQITMTGTFAPTYVQGQGSFQAIDLERLHQQLAGLDTLFPLLKHMRGTISGHLRAYLPFRQEKLKWAEAEGELTANLRNVVILESPYTYELFSLIPLTDFKRIEIGHVETKLTLREGILRTDTTWLQANRWRMRVAGAHTLQGELAYDLLVEVPRILLDKSTQRVAEFVEESEGERLRLYVTVSGTTQAPKFSWKTRQVGPKRATQSPEPEKKQKKRSKREPLPVQEE